MVTFFLLLVSALFFFVNSKVFFDADFGWHLRLGEIIAREGFPVLDPFGYSMPSYRIIEHEWLVDILFAKLYPLIGADGLAFIFSLIGVAAVYISVKQAKTSLAFPVLILLGVSAFQPFFTISAKAVSWLLFSVLVALVFNNRLWKKYWILIFPLTVVWVNTHGSFPLAVAILATTLTFRPYENLKLKIKELCLFLGVLLSTLINPYGLRIWEIAIKTVSDRQIGSVITEWRPAHIALTQYSYSFLLLVAVFLILSIRFGRQVSREKLVFSFLLLVATVFTVRYLQYWVLTALPLIAVELMVMERNIVKNEISRNRLTKTYRFLLWFGLLFLGYQFLGVIGLGKAEYAFKNYYPVEAVNFLKNNPHKKEIFSEYKWGGYLIWKLPENKVFIYGMMPVWKNSQAPENESEYALGEYLDIVNGRVDYRVAFHKYNIKTVMLSRNNSSLEDKLIADSWRLVYKDGTAVIYEIP